MKIIDETTEKCNHCKYFKPMIPDDDISYSNDGVLTNYVHVFCYNQPFCEELEKYLKGERK